MAVLFDRTNAEHLEDDDATRLNVGTSSFTLMTWAKWTLGSTDMQLVGKGNAGAGGIRYLLRANTDGTARAAVDDNVLAAINVDSVTGSLNDGVLRHFAMVVNKSDDTLKLYINGVEEASASIVGLGTLTSDVDFKIGAQGDTSLIPFSGTQEDCRLYLRALSGAEVKTIANSRGHDGILGDLLARWPMNERHAGVAVTESPVTVLDVSGNGFNLIGHGDTTFLPEYAGSELAFEDRSMRG